MRGTSFPGNGGDRRGISAARLKSAAFLLPRGLAPSVPSLQSGWEETLLFLSLSLPYRIACAPPLVKSAAHCTAAAKVSSCVFYRKLIYFTIILFCNAPGKVEPFLCDFSVLCCARMKRPAGRCAACTAYGSFCGSRPSASASACCRSISRRTPTRASTRRRCGRRTSSCRCLLR